MDSGVGLNILEYERFLCPAGHRTCIRSDRVKQTGFGGSVVEIVSSMDHSTPVQIKLTSGNKNSGATSGHDGVTCNGLGAVGVVGME